MRIQDQVILALTIWRENRGGGEAGMQSVANVILNRVVRRGTSAYAECTRALEFSSITARGDAELTLWPSDGDEEWGGALELAGGALPDMTQGATLYYAPKGLTVAETSQGKLFALPGGQSVAFPNGWNEAAVDFTVEIAGQLFFREV